MKIVALLIGGFAIVALANANVLNILKLIDTSPRIVNGFNSTRGQFPHQALIIISHGENRTALCGGSLISDRWVVTAAHCTLNGESFEVHLGALNRRDLNEEGRVIQKARRNIEHPNYYPNLVLNDIALLELAEPVEFSETISPIELPDVTNTLYDIPAIASGFGRTNTTASPASILQWALFDTVSNIKCAQLFGDIVGALVLRPSVICAVGRQQSSGCAGDSGGPLTTEDGVLIGLTSFGTSRGCHLGYPTVYTNIVYYLEWIQLVTGIGGN